MDVKCGVCLLSVPKSDRRRNLSSASSKHVCVELKDFMRRKWPQVMLNSAQERVLYSFVCIQCFRNLEKLQKWRENVQDMESKLVENLRRLVESNEAEETAGSGCMLSTTPRRSKRQRKEDSAPIPAKRRSLSVTTPVKSAIQRLQPSQASPLVAVVEKASSAKTATVRCLPRSLKTIGRGIARKSLRSVALQALKHKRIRANITKYLGKDIRKEMTGMCSKQHTTVFRGSSAETLGSFSWDGVADELERRAPTLHAILKECVEVKRRERPSKKRRRGSYRPSNSAVIGICACILMRHKNQQMNVLQRMISLILQRGHAGKQVYRRLRKLLLCLSHQRSTDYLDELSKNFNAEVVSWRDDLLSAMRSDENHEETSLHTSAEDGNSQVMQVLPESADGSLDLIASDDDDARSLCSSSFSASETEPSQSSASESEELCYSSLTSLESSPASSPNHNSSRISVCALNTFKIVGDNVDKEVKPKDMRSDYQTRSLHYFHCYAVRDRVKLDSYDDSPSLPNIDTSTVDLESILPTTEDERVIRSNMAVLIARTLMKHVPFFKTYGRGVERHITHQFHEEMSKKSTVVPLGVILKNEQRLEDMVDIMCNLQKYVPTITSTEKVSEPENDSHVTVTIDNFHYTLFGGDQMTAVRARSSQRVRNNSERGKDRLEGLQPVVEDWHAKVCFLGVIWTRLYKCSSGMDDGSLYQLRNLINRRNVVKDPTNNVAACEDFFMHVVEAHILSACMTEFEMSSVDDTPSSKHFTEDSVEFDPIKRRDILLTAVNKVTDKFVDFSIGKRRADKSTNVAKDRQLAYACDVLMLGLLYMEFTDAIREGDGERILRCWRYLLLVFKACGRKNYAIEAFTMLAQYHFLFSERMRMQLIWSRTVNVHGRPGRNISCDLHNEHLNRELKESISGLGANITDRAIQRIGTSLRATREILARFDKINGIPPISGHHTVRSSAEDMRKLVKQLHQDTKVFAVIPGRHHSNFPKFRYSVFKRVSKRKLHKWLHKRYKSLITYQ